MKKLLIALAVLLVIVAGAVLVLPALIPTDRIRQEVAAQVKAATGRDLTIGGDVSASVIPALAVKANDVALSNPPGFQGKEMARLGALDVRLKLLPLLSGKVEVDSFVLVDPVIALEVNRQGQANWDFATTKTPATVTEPQPSAEDGGASPLKNLSLGEVRIDNGTLTYADAASGTKQRAEAINLALTLANLDSPLNAKGSLTWQGKPIALTLGVAQPRAVINGAASPVTLTLDTEAVTLNFKGEAAKDSVKGDLDLSVPSVRGLISWTTGKPLEMAGAGLERFSLKGKVAAGGTKAALTQAAIVLDAITATGDFTVDTAGPRPSLKGRLDVAALDLNPYLPPARTAQGDGGTGGGAGQPAGWSDDPIDASALRTADLDFGLSAGSITIQKIKIGQSALHLALNAGRLTADLQQLALYDGNAHGRLSLDGSQPGTVGVDAGLTLKGLAAHPFLSDAAGLDWLEGTANSDIQVTAHGKSQRALVSGLDGKGSVTFQDGAIRGINLAEMVRNVGSAFTDRGGSQKTDFTELGGTFTITDGIVRNQDLALQSPLLRVEGAGTVELPPRTVHYRLEPKAVPSLQGQGGKSDVSGLAVPIIIEGSWDKPSFRPDVEALLKSKAGEKLQKSLGEKLPADKLPIDPRKLFGR